MIKILFFIAFFSLSILAETTSLKKVSFENETSDKQSKGLASENLSSDDSKKLMEDIELIKKKQEESKKILDELEKDE